MANGNANQEMARLIVAEKKSEGNYRYREKMVPVDEVEDEIKAIKAAATEQE